MQENKIIYVQSNDDIAEAFSEIFVENGIEMLRAKTGEEALETIGREKVLLLLVDKNIQDIGLRQFIDRVRTIAPQIIVNVCADFLDPLQLTKLTNRHRIQKIYIEPWDVDEIAEEIKESLEIAIIDEETSIREESVSSEKEELEETLKHLTGTLKKQQYSYTKLTTLTSCFAKALLNEEKNDVIAQKRFKFAQDAYHKMLLFQTTGSFDIEKFEGYIRSDLEQIKEISKGYHTKDVVSCLLGGQSRTRASNIRFSIYLIAKLYAQFYDSFSIKVSSHFITTQKAEFDIEVVIEGKMARGSAEELNDYRKYVNDMISALSESFGENDEVDEATGNQVITYRSSFIVTRE